MRLQRYNNKTILALVLIAVLVLAGGAWALHKHNAKKEQAVPVTAGQSTKGEPGSSSGSNSTSSQGGSSVPPTQSQKDTGNSGSGTTLMTPTGDFVSNHHLSLSGSSAPNTVTSVCNTTPGASCQITFTNSGVTKSLAAQTTDAGGATYWNNWKLQDIGVTQGNWKVQAIASLNGQTKTASDGMDLVVSP